MIPYALPAVLMSAPTGISWETIPDLGSTPQAQQAEAINMLWRATSKVEAFCNQTLRATLDPLDATGPYRRLTIDAATGNARVQLDQWPVLAAVSVQCSGEQQFPRQWQTVPLTNVDLEYAPPLQNGVPTSAAIGPSAIVIAPGYVWRTLGRRGYRIHVQYVNGWPHAGVTAAVTAGATTVQVDDVTGYGMAGQTIASTGFVWPSVVGTLFDGTNTEVVQVTGVTATNGSTGIGAYGPGTLTLSTGTQFAHAGLLYGYPQCQISTMPMVIQEAVINFAVAEALIRGATATNVPEQPGTAHDGVSGKDAMELAAFEKLLPFKRML